MIAWEFVEKQEGMAKAGNFFRYTPTWWGQAANFCHWKDPCTNNLGLAGSILICFLGIWLVFRNHKKWEVWQAACIGIFVALQVTPYLWAYDQILLLLPILLITKYLFRSKKELLAAIFPLFISLFSFLFLFIAVQSGKDNLSYWLTFSMAAIWSIIFLRDSNAGKQTV